jgi:two-component system chemotaxis response regulator CheY
MRTLVVEDELTSRLMMQSVLCGYGECHSAVDGEEALEAVRMAMDCSRTYDLICMDIKMPGMSGVEAVRQIRGIEERHGVLSTRGAKILMATALESPQDVIQSFKALCDEYLVKPIDSRKLLEKLRVMKLID